MAQVDILDLRTRLGGAKPISQAELGRRIGVDQSTISRWETGSDEPQGPAAILLQQLDELTPCDRRSRERASA